MERFVLEEEKMWEKIEKKIRCLSLLLDNFKVLFALGEKVCQCHRKHLTAKVIFYIRHYSNKWIKVIIN